MGTLSWSVCMVLAHLHLTGHALPAVDAGRIGLSRRAVRYTEPDTGAQHEGHVLDLVFGAGEEVGPAGAALDLGRQVELIFADPVGALHRASGLSRAALWRIVGDSLSGAMLEAGQHLGQAERAMDEARAILASRETKLHSRQTHFIRIEVPDLTGPDGAPVCEWFRARGGCCRYYTVEGGEYCTTCVLRNAESRDERLRDYLREKHAGAA